MVIASSVTMVFLNMDFNGVVGQDESGSFFSKEASKGCKYLRSLGRGRLLDSLGSSPITSHTHD